MSKDISPKMNIPTAEEEIIIPKNESLSDFVGGQYIKNPVIVQQGHLQSPNFVTGTSGWKIDANGDAEFQSVTAGAYIQVFVQAGIPTSLHVNDVWYDSDDGNKPYRAAIVGADQITAGEWEAINNPTEWADVADGSSTKPDNNADVTSANTAAAIASQGNLATQNYADQVGPTGGAVLYNIVTGGIFSFGDGSDGAYTTTGNETLTEDKYYTNLTVATGHTLNPGGYRIFVSGTLTLEGTGKIARDGNDGSDGVSATGGAGGVALADGYLKGSVTGANGVNGGCGSTNGDTGTAGTATANSIGSNGVAGGAGGASESYTGGAGGGGGTATTSNVKLIANWHLATLLDVSSTGASVKFDNSAACGSGGSGAKETCGGGNSGGSGGAGSSGGIIAIYAKNIVIGASASIAAIGGNGGMGGGGTNNGASPGHGGGGGGAGGNGGQVILVYNTLTNNGTISVAGGTGGAGGAGGAGSPTGSAGVAGTNGTAGTLRQFNISL